MKILLFGMNHRSAPLEVRERFAVSDPVPHLAKLIESEEIDEAVLVSTCNRVEVIVTTQKLESARHRLQGFFRNELGGGEPLPGGLQLADCSYEHLDRDAVSHLFRVASSIDSMVVGEPQILGQIKDAYRDAAEFGACGPVLSRLFQRAFGTAKRVKNETRVSEGPVSVARVAVELARQIFEGFDDKSALLIGAGEMIEASLLALQRAGLSKVRIANRSVENASELAQRFGATAHGLSEVEELLAQSDIVLSCIGGESTILGLDQVRSALRDRSHRPAFLIDIGVPRNIDPQVNGLESAYLYDIDDLQGVAAQNAAERGRESDRAEQIVAEEEQRFGGWLVALEAVPTIRHLRARAESVRQAELDRALRRSGVDGESRELMEELTRSIVNKLLHEPLTRLRAQTDREEGLATLEAARSLFGLDDEDPELLERRHAETAPVEEDE